MTPTLLGLSHVSLSVHNRVEAERFWTDVLDFELLEKGEEFSFLLDRGAGLAIILSDHGGAVSGSFDENHVGLDHLAFAVPDVETLLTWKQRLTRFGVPHSAITESDAGHHLNLRAPDRVPVELFVLKSQFAAQLGLDDRVPVAATHR